MGRASVEAELPAWRKRWLAHCSRQAQANASRTPPRPVTRPRDTPPRLHRDGVGRESSLESSQRQPSLAVLDVAGVAGEDSRQYFDPEARGGMFCGLPSGVAMLQPSLTGHGGARPGAYERRQMLRQSVPLLLSGEGAMRHHDDIYIILYIYIYYIYIIIFIDYLMVHNNISSSYHMYNIILYIPSSISVPMI
jgi:hypothetical protein